MATLVFSAVGTALGGPIGGAIGSMMGRQLDTVVFGSPHREGARLKELEVTTSSYGQPLPRHFGRMRVAGQMIWATDLAESSETLGGGKSGAAITSYAYTASFAVALASRPITGLGRIWADGRLLRGAEGDLKCAGTLRIHHGHADQPCDPLIFAAEGNARCPAHRDLAYVVFEDLDLSEFYNRIPSLTFEVLADETFDLAAIVGDLVEDVEAAVPLDGFLGMTCNGPLSGALQTIDQVIPLDLDAGPETLVIARRLRQARSINLGEATISADDGEFGGASGFSRDRAIADDTPVSLLRYFDSERDYLPSVQHASGQAAIGAPRAIELPVALDATTARTLIERNRRRADWSRERITWRTGALDPEVAPGALVSFPGIAGQWRVLEWEWRHTGVEISAAREATLTADMPGQASADPGRINPPQDLPSAETVLTAFELPLDPTGGDSGRPRLFAAVSSAGANWRGAALFADRGDGELHPLGPSGRRRTIMGTTLTGLPASSPLLFARGSGLEVVLVDPAMQLGSATTRQLAEGANLVLVGDEILQFAQAISLSGGRWRLSGFLRGRGATEAIAHLPDEPVVLLDGSSIALDAAIVGTAVDRRIVALGTGDQAAVLAPVRASGLTLRPPAPVHPRAMLGSDGVLSLRWVRRARGEWTWQDGIDVPLVEQAESYLLGYGPVGSPIATWTLTQPSAELSPATLAELSTRLPGGVFRVRQQGTHALSAPLTLFQLT
ncbi:phage tail protein [Novosphingobium sp. ZW T3_23]|uniref:phage tail protein n=1 Tax=Novosphingobium sp. ZW T3_23 TaxID=3378084 RepID=UPI00385388C4